MGKYVFRPYPDIAPAYFLAEKKHIETHFENSQIEHVGSTAIPGLGGKGILDILMGVNQPLERYQEILESIGYELRPKGCTIHRLFFRKITEGSIPCIHLHLTQYNAQDWVEMTGFRDALLNHSDWVKSYAQIKKKAVQVAQGVGDKYKATKAPFIRRVLLDYFNSGGNEAKKS